MEKKSEEETTCTKDTFRSHLMYKRYLPQVASTDTFPVDSPHQTKEVLYSDTFFVPENS